MSRRLVALGAVLTLVGWGCNSRLIRPPATIYVDGGESDVAPSLDEEDQQPFPAVYLSYLPSQIELHPGDGIRFDMRYNGEPHTVAFGTLIDSALAAVEALGPAADVRAIEELAEMRAIPSVFPDVVTTDAPVLNASASKRCFLDTEPPATSAEGGAEACPEREQPDFDGMQSFYSSGFIPEGESFRLKLSGDIRPGDYGYMCLVHRAAMTGNVEVVSPDAERPTVAQVKVKGRDEQRVVAAAVTTAAGAAAERGDGPVLAGAGPEGEVRGFVAGFVPDEITVPLGEPVTWAFFEMHSISFSPERRAKDGIILQERGGEVRINLDAWRPVGGSPPQPPAALQYPPPPEPVVIDGGTWGGEGSFSSGVIRATPPAAVTYALRFSKTGTYAYSCLVHGSMRGRVEVTG